MLAKVSVVNVVAGHAPLPLILLLPCINRAARVVKQRDEFAAGVFPVRPPVYLVKFQLDLAAGMKSMGNETNSSAVLDGGLHSGAKSETLPAWPRSVLWL